MGGIYQVNLIAVLIAGLANMVIGALWYSPVLFGSYWMKLMNIKKKDMKRMQKEASKGYVFGLLSSLLTSFVIAIFIKLVRAHSIEGGALVGGLAWLGFVATTSAQSVLWEGKKVELYTLNNAYNLASFVVMGIILAVWV